MFHQGLSDLGYAQAVAKERLVSELLYQLLGVQAGDDGFDEQLEDALRGLERHKFLDVNPAEVDDLYRRLSDRLGEFAQFDKQRALGLLQRRLLGLPLPSLQYDLPHRVLALLYSAAQAPLDAEYKGAALVDRLLEEEQAAGRAQPTYLSDSTEGGSWEVEEVPAGSTYSSGDSLSDWSDVDGGVEGYERPEAAGAMEPAAEESPGGDEGRPAPGMPSPHRRPLAAALVDSSSCPLPLARQAAVPRQNPYQRHSLAVWLAARRSGGQPARVLNPQLCFTEAELLQQVLHMLEGVSTPGPAFHLDPVQNAYVVAPGVHTSGTSHAATRALLQRFAGLGSALRSVQEFCAGMLAPAAGGGGSMAEGEEEEEDWSGVRRLQQLPTAVAFAAALDTELKAVRQQLIPLEVAARSGALSLLRLEQQVEGLRRLAAALQRAARQCMWRGSGAETAAGLLDALHDMVQQELVQAASQGGALAAMLLAVFAATARPYLDRLDAWVSRGELEDDVAGELFIFSDPSVPPASFKFWHSAYRLRLSPDGSPAAPSFLQPLADALLAAGKSAVLLRAGAERASPAAAAAGAAGELWRSGASGSFAGSLGGGGASQNLATLLSWCSGASSLLQQLATPRPAGGGSPSLARNQQQSRRLDSPTKRRLHEISALGFAVATGGEEDAAGPDAGSGGLDGAAGLARGSLLPPEASSEPGGAEEAGQQQPPLHARFVERLQWLLQPAPSTLTAPPAAAACAADGGVPAAPASEQADGITAPPAGSPSGDDTYEEEEEDWLGAAAACNGHALNLAPEDDLPSLLPLPRSVLQLQAQQAVIRPEALPDAAPAAPGCSAAGDGSGSSGKDACQAASAQQSSAAASMAQRMRQAARQRVAQASGEGCALDLLPALLQPPAPLATLSLAPAAKDGREEDGEGGGSTPPSEPAAAAPAFDSSAWAAWYERVSSALSAQLAAIDAGVCGSGMQQGGALALGSSALAGCWRPLAVGGAQREGQLRLRPGMCTHARPLDSLLQQSLLWPLQLQAQRMGAALTASLLQAWGLRRQLLTLREVYLLATPLMKPFLESIFLRISSRHGLGSVSEFDVSAALQQCFLAAGREDLLGITAEILPEPSSPKAADHHGSSQHRADATMPPSRSSTPAGAAGAAAAAAAAGGGMPSVHTLSRLRLRLECGWPLCLVASDEMLQQYNAVLVLLMQAHWVKRSMDSLQRSRFAKWKGARPKAGSGSGGGVAQRAQQSAKPSGDGDLEAHSSPPHQQHQLLQRQLSLAGERDGALHQMSHLTEAVLQYTTERLMAAWQWLEESLAGCASLDELQRCHAKYLAAVRRYCLLAPDTLSRLVHDALLRLLDCALSYAWLSMQLAKAGAAAEAARTAGPLAAQSGAAARQREGALRAQLAGVRREFGNRQRLLVKVLASRAGEQGARAGELRHLLAAVDFNYYWQRGQTAPQ